MSGRKHWRGIDRRAREQALKDALRLAADRRGAEVRLRGAAINKAMVSPEDPMEYAFEQLCNRFDRFLLRLHRQGNTQRGLIVLDKSTYETSLQGLSREFGKDGHRWGKLANLAEVPLFVDSAATRMVQYADLIAFAVRRRYERHDPTFFDIIKESFDSEGGLVHGLVHYRNRVVPCSCPVCV